MAERAQQVILTGMDDDFWRAVARAREQARPRTMIIRDLRWLPWPIRLRLKLLVRRDCQWNAWVRDFTAWLERKVIR